LYTPELRAACSLLSNVAVGAGPIPTEKRHKISCLSVIFWLTGKYFEAATLITQLEEALSRQYKQAHKGV